MPDLLQASESADQAIQKLLQSLDVFNEPEREVPALVPYPDTPSTEAAPPVPLRPSACPSSPNLKRLSSRQNSRRQSRLPQPAPSNSGVDCNLRQSRPSASRPRNPSPSSLSRAIPAGLRLPSVPPKSVLLPLLFQPLPRAPANVQTRPILAEQPKSGQKQVDEWQKFARELEALPVRKNRTAYLAIVGEA